MLPDPVYGRFGVTVYPGDCRDVLPALPDSSVDAVVTDPPYELGFMGKGWDSTGVAYDVDMWRQCLRVLKPGGHLLAFGGTRTWHRLVCAVEDAGFEIRDSIAWMYATGYPKSLDVSKAIDKRGGTDGAWFAEWLATARAEAGMTRDEVSKHFPSKAGGTTGKVWNWEHGHGVCTQGEFDRLCDLFGLPRQDVFDAEGDFIAARRGTHGRFGPGDTRNNAPRRSVRAAATDAAKQWEGWGTALKPAFEPIVVARKPLAGTVAGNVLEYGAGALNIDGCRVEAGQDYRDKCASVVGLDSNQNGAVYGEWTGTRTDSAHAAGRWPTNVVLTHAADPDGVDLCVDSCVPGCVVADLDEQGGNRPGFSSQTDRAPNKTDGSTTYGAGIGSAAGFRQGYNDAGGASRFFPVFRFEAKAPGSERPRVDGIAHPTVKPLGLLRWLVRLVTPPRGIVLDPFAGTGVTGQACRAENMACTLIERDKVSIPLIRARLDRQPAGTGRRATATNPAPQFDLFSTEDV